MNRSHLPAICINPLSPISLPGWWHLRGLCDWLAHHIREAPLHAQQPQWVLTNPGNTAASIQDSTAGGHAASSIRSCVSPTRGLPFFWCSASSAVGVQTSSGALLPSVGAPQLFLSRWLATSFGLCSHLRHMVANENLVRYTLYCKHILITTTNSLQPAPAQPASATPTPPMSSFRLLAPQNSTPPATPSTTSSGHVHLPVWIPPTRRGWS
jgi:hypothetical protein